MHQYLFYIGDFPIRAYGLVLSLSIILATGVGYFLAKADGRGYEKYVVDLGIYCGVAGLVGARLWDVFFFDWAYYHDHLTELLNVWQGGMAIQGGVLLGVLTGIWYCRRHGLDTLHLMDVLAPAIILGQALGRCANLLNGDAFGAPTGSAFGILYPTTTLAYHTYGDQQLWPAEIWEGQLDTAIFALLLHLPGKQHLIGGWVMTQQAMRLRAHGLRQCLITGQVDQKLSGLNDCAGALTRHCHALLLGARQLCVSRKNKPKPPRPLGGHA